MLFVWVDRWYNYVDRLVADNGSCGCSPVCRYRGVGVRVSKEQAFFRRRVEHNSEPGFVSGVSGERG